MAKIVASDFVTLDGYMVGENEDMSWVIDNFNEDMGEEMRGHLSSIGGVILGRVTYEIMVAYWPNAIPDGNYDEIRPAEGSEDPIIADRMNNLPKIVFSRTLEKAEWGKYNNATLMNEITHESIGNLKKHEGKPWDIQGSASIVQQLLNIGLLDELRLMIFPVILGKGKPLFSAMDSKKLKLIESKALISNGVVINRYQVLNH
jgi:dihydrofolate reductase